MCWLCCCNSMTQSVHIPCSTLMIYSVCQLKIRYKRIFSVKENRGFPISISGGNIETAAESRDLFGTADCSTAAPVLKSETNESVRFKITVSLPNLAKFQPVDQVIFACNLLPQFAFFIQSEEIAATFDQSKLKGGPNSTTWSSYNNGKG